MVRGHGNGLGWELAKDFAFGGDGIGTGRAHDVKARRLACRRNVL